MAQYQLGLELQRVQPICPPVQPVSDRTRPALDSLAGIVRPDTPPPWQGPAGSLKVRSAGRPAFRVRTRAHTPQQWHSSAGIPDLQPVVSSPLRMAAPRAGAVPLGRCPR